MRARTVLALLIALPALAAAQAQGQAQAQAQDKPAATSGAPRRKVIRLEAITVEGRIQKPQAFYILQRSQLSFEELNRTDSFLPKVVKSVDKDPF